MTASAAATGRSGAARVRRRYTVGIEEEVMLLDPHDWSLAQQIDDVLCPRSPPSSPAHVTAETHGSALELAHRRARDGRRRGRRAARAARRRWRAS